MLKSSLFLGTRLTRPSLTARVVLTRANSTAAVVDNPYSGEIYCEVPYLSNKAVNATVDQAVKAQREWASTSLEKRAAVCLEAMKIMTANKEQIGRDITGQMGRPYRFAVNETKGMNERANAMIDMAADALKGDVLPLKEGFHRALVREPVGVVAVIAPWNYPLLTTVNSVVPAVMAGNSVVIKHSPRTPLIAEHFARAFDKAGAPAGLVSACNTTHDGVAQLLANPAVGFAVFTGSVQGGHAIYKEAAKRFLDVGLELGGKDPAYVLEDADLDFAVENIIDGAFFNSGQSCCAVERVYVHEALYDRFVDKALALVQAYRLGDPMADQVDLGPMALTTSVPFLTAQVEEARQKGARVLCGGTGVHDAAGKGRFFAPTLLTGVDHSMRIMVEESFGPVLGVMKVASDAEALRLMNDSPYGLTASLWTRDNNRAAELARHISTGTVFKNRCDYLDPQLAWTGVRDSGKGISLSKHGYNAFTRVKSLHFRL